MRRRRKAPLYMRQPETLVVTAFRNGRRDIHCRIAAPNVSMVSSSRYFRLLPLSLSSFSFFPTAATRICHQQAWVALRCSKSFPWGRNGSSAIVVDSSWCGSIHLHGRALQEPVQTSSTWVELLRFPWLVFHWPIHLFWTSQLLDPQKCDLVMHT